VLAATYFSENVSQTTIKALPVASIVLFGGSGFVGTHLQLLLGGRYERIYIADIRPPRWHTGDVIPLNPRVVHVRCDIRRPIDPAAFGADIEAIINLAAVHTSPGHPAHEYFEANILGARHVCAFAESRGIDRILFTSSISVYGPGEDEKTEDSLYMPNIPYGSSKAIAEYEHRRWFERNPRRRFLSIVRPGVIFGIGEGGNFTRIANLLQKGFFPFPGRTDTIKACLYVKDLCRFLLSRLEGPPGDELYNFCYPEKTTSRAIVDAFKSALGYRALTPVVPLWLVNTGAAALRPVQFPFIQRMGLVPDRIVKLVRSTNISSRKLVDSGFAFRYPLEEALKDWSRDCGGTTLF
jgi:nucleoside-diphosphate-sugar epimerase